MFTRSTDGGVCILADRLHIHLKKRYGAFELTVKNDIKLDGFTVLFGPSGSGKSTFLRLVAGFETPDTGVIKFNQTVWADAKTQRPPNKRPVGFMFQSGELFPHLTVKKNLEYSDRRNKNTGSNFIGPHLSDVIERFDLSALLHRKPERLSGGERQRVALARTVLRRPKLLLLDEPLAALDRKRKREILPFLKRLPTEFSMPCLYVSHDIEEVSSIADRVMLIDEGKITDTGAALDILHKIGEDEDSANPSIGSVFNARFIAYHKESGLSLLRLGAAELSVPARISGPLNTPRRIRIAAENVAISRVKPEGLSIRNCLSARIESITINTDSPFALLTLTLENAPQASPLLRARITRASVMDLDLNEGQSVFALVKSVSFAKTLL